MITSKRWNLEKKGKHASELAKRLAKAAQLSEARYLELVLVPEILSMIIRE